LRTKPDEARQVHEGLHAIEGRSRTRCRCLVHALQRVKVSDVAYFQKFYDLFSDKGIFEKKVIVEPLLFKG